MKRRGRPRLDDNDRSVSVGVKLTTTQYDQVYARASRDRVTVPEQIRRDVRQAAAAEKKVGG